MPVRHGATTKHTMSKEYAAWAAMHRRCDNPRNPNFPRYGGRGIAVCDRWARFDEFFADMGPCPPGLTLERIDNSKGYEPNNCKWATYSEQNRNTSQTRWMTFDGVTMCMQDWCTRTGLSRNTINGRLKMGWPVERILTTPVGFSRFHKQS